MPPKIKAKPKTKAKPKAKKPKAKSNNTTINTKDKSVKQTVNVVVNSNNSKPRSNSKRSKPQEPKKPEVDFYDLLQYRMSAPVLQTNAQQDNQLSLGLIKHLITNHTPTKITNDINTLTGTKTRDKFAGLHDQQDYHDYDHLESVSVVDNQSVAPPPIIFDIPPKQPSLINIPPKQPSLKSSTSSTHSSTWNKRQKELLNPSGGGKAESSHSNKSSYSSKNSDYSTGTNNLMADHMVNDLLYNFSNNQVSSIVNSPEKQVINPKKKAGRPTIYFTEAEKKAAATLRQRIRRKNEKEVLRIKSRENQYQV